MIQLRPSFSISAKRLSISFWLVLASYSLILAQQQEITEKDKLQQEQVLKEDPKNFAAHYLIGAYYYNQAVDPHVETTKMGVEEYLQKGEELEKLKAKFLRKSLPYFENAYTIDNRNLQVRQVLKTIYQQLGTIPVSKASEREIEQALTEQLASLEFKQITSSQE